MKKTGLAVLVCIWAVILTGCGKTGGGVSLESMEKLNQNGELLSMTEISFYEQDDEKQACWNDAANHSMVKTDNGYYFAGESPNSSAMVLGHIDEEKEQCVPVCGKEGCGHRTGDCSAYFKGYEDQVWYYKGQMYAVKQEYGRATLVQISLDGTQRKDLFEVANAGVSKDTATDTRIVFGNDCVYAYDRVDIRNSKEDETSIRKRSLDGKTDEKIITTKEKNGTFDNAMCYGGNLFFTYYRKNFDNTNKKIVTESTGLYCYDSHTGKVSRILDLNISDYAIDMEKMTLYCYVMYEGLYAYDLKTGERKLLYAAEDNTQICHFSYDEKYFYLDNMLGVYNISWDFKDSQHKVILLDKEGKKLDKIINIENKTILFGDDKERLFMSGGASHKINMGNKIYTYTGPYYLEKPKLEEHFMFKPYTWSASVQEN